MAKDSIHHYLHKEALSMERNMQRRIDHLLLFLQSVFRNKHNILRVSLSCDFNFFVIYINIVVFTGSSIA